ncbi:hypothetical protein EJB05_30069 [Eragrostis curvula]|uniref:SGNH hydrolase-type esterase domain-containing protein n=1 Tax=Eragrostis curvula TaxID=38414 RepID=A0A5J9UW13_9POAL|nr:hypothetical protein EJB05_30069 [Eragrostis curvula]
MKIHAVCCCCILLLVLISGGHHVTVEARGHSDRRREYKLLVFGDSFADTGNRAPATSDKTSASRMWYYPYGSSDSAHGNRATGRLSDGLVQSDFLARIVGLNECPSPYRVWDRNAEFSGVNFAVAGAGALDGSPEVPSLSQQINQLRRLVDAGDIDDSDLDDSVALIAIDGPKDYVSVNETTSANQIGALSQDVTDEIVDGVRRLQRLGVSKVLVNNLPPIGCQPWRSLSTGYNSCDNKGDMISIMHNTALTQKLRSSSRGGVLVLDLYAVFNNLLGDSNSGFRHNNRPLLAPCCDTADPMGYCGQEDNWGRRLYSVCPTPDQTFYWDYVHPTQAAWRAIMNQLQGPIQDFLGI